MRPHPIGRMNRLVVKTVEIDRIRAINRDSPLSTKSAHGIDQLEIFVLVMAAERSRKKNQRKSASVAEDEHLEIAAQMRRPPSNIAFVHVCCRFERSQRRSREISSYAVIAVETTEAVSRSLTCEARSRVGQVCQLQRKRLAFMPEHTLTGNIQEHPGFVRRFCGNRRDVLVYLPRGYRRWSLERYPVLYLHDGQNVFDAATSFGGVEWGVDETAQRLIRSNLIEPLIIVAVANTGEERIHEYAPTRGGSIGEAQTQQRSVAKIRTFPCRRAKAVHRSEISDATRRGIDRAGRFFVRRTGDARARALVPKCIFAARRHVAIGLVGRLRRFTEWWTIARGQTAAKNLARYRNAGARLGTGARTCAIDWSRRAGGIYDDLQYHEVEGADHSEGAWAARFDAVLALFVSAAAANDEETVAAAACPGISSLGKRERKRVGVRHPERTRAI